MLLLKSGSAAKCWRVFTTQATLFRFKFPVGVSLLILASEQVPRCSTDAPRMLHGFSARQMPERGSQQILADLLPIFSGNQRLNYQHSGDGERERRREEEEEERGGRKRRRFSLNLKNAVKDAVKDAVRDSVGDVVGDSTDRCNRGGAVSPMTFDPSPSRRRPLSPSNQYSMNQSLIITDHQ